MYVRIDKMHVPLQSFFCMIKWNQFLLHRFIRGDMVLDEIGGLFTELYLTHSIKKPTLYPAS